MHLTPVSTTYSIFLYGGLPRKLARIWKPFCDRGNLSPIIFSSCVGPMVFDVPAVEIRMPGLLIGTFTIAEIVEFRPRFLPVQFFRIPKSLCSFGLMRFGILPTRSMARMLWVCKEFLDWAFIEPPGHGFFKNCDALWYVLVVIASVALLKLMKLL